MDYQIAYPNPELDDAFLESVQNELPSQLDRIVKLSKRLYIAENEVSNTPHAIKNKRGIQRSIDREVKDIVKMMYYGMIPNDPQTENIFWNNLSRLIYLECKNIKDSKTINADIQGYLRERE